MGIRIWHHNHNVTSSTVKTMRFAHTLFGATSFRKRHNGVYEPHKYAVWWSEAINRRNLMRSGQVGERKPRAPTGSKVKLQIRGGLAMKFFWSVGVYHFVQESSTNINVRRQGFRWTNWRRQTFLWQILWRGWCWPYLAQGSNKQLMVGNQLIFGWTDARIPRLIEYLKWGCNGVQASL